MCLEDPGRAGEASDIDGRTLSDTAGAEAKAAEALEQQMLRRLDGQTFLVGKRVARQKLPDLPEHTETTVHRVKVSLLRWRIRWRVILPGLDAEGAGAPDGEDGQVAGPTRKPGQGRQRDAGVKRVLCPCRSQRRLARMSFIRR